jgi:hypothetical protein
VRAIAAAVCQRVAELPDRNSPEDWPEAMLVTGQELIDVVTCELEQAQAAPALEAPPGVAGRTVPRNDDERAAAQFFADNPGAALLAWPLYLARDKSLTLEAPAAPVDEREHFEAWAKDRGYQSDELARCKLGFVSPAYFNLNTENAFQAWQARAALAAAPQAPAALDELRQIAAIAACWGCDHPDEPGDTEVVRRVKWAARQLRAVAQAPAAPAVDASDKALLDFLRDTSCDLRSIDVPTGGDDSDVHWRVIEHYMSEPREREIGRSWSDDPREAIRAAIAAQAKEGGA